MPFYENLNNFNVSKGNKSIFFTTVGCRVLTVQELSLIKTEEIAKVVVKFSFLFSIKYKGVGRLKHL